MTEEQVIEDKIKYLQGELKAMGLKRETAEQARRTRSLEDLSKLSEFTDAEKCAAFDLLYNKVYTGLEHYVKERRQRKDEVHFTYELAVELTVGNVAFWIINDTL